MRHFIWICTAVVFLAAAAPGFAQEPRPERPSRALFGSSVATDTAQLFTLSGQLGLGWDTHVGAGARGLDRARPTDLARERRGSLGQGNAALSYQLQHDRVTFGASGVTSARYYPSLSDEVYTARYGQIRGSLALPFSTNVHGSVGYRPYSVVHLFPGLFRGDPALARDENFDAAEPEFETSPDHYLTWTGGIGTGRDLQITQRLRFKADTTYRTRTVSRGQDQYQTYGVGGVLRYAVAKGLDLKSGYQFGRAEYTVSDRGVTRHVLDLGADFSRNLSFSRRTTVSFSSGTSAVTHPENSGRTRFRAAGSADLTHEIGRTWSATVSYARGVHFIETWPEPVSSDGVAVSFGGLFSRRLRFSSNARAASGRIGFNRQDSSGFDTYYGNASLSYALTRFTSIGARYANYHHKFNRAGVMPPGLSPWVDRHTVTVQVSLFAPLYQQARREDATR